MAIEGLTVGKINQLLNNYLQGKSDGTGSTKVEHPIQTVLNGAKAQVTKILQNNGSETQLNDDTEITTNENNAAELEITISGSFSTEGIDNEKAVNNLKSTGNYKVFFKCRENFSFAAAAVMIRQSNVINTQLSQICLQSSYFKREFCLLLKLSTSFQLNFNDP